MSEDFYTTKIINNIDVLIDRLEHFKKVVDKHKDNLDFLMSMSIVFTDIELLSNKIKYNKKKIEK